MTIDINRLANEIEVDPAGLGYVGLDASAILALITDMTKRTETVDSLSGLDVMKAVVPSEVAALTDVEVSTLVTLFSLDEIDASVGGVGQAVMLKLFASNSGTITNLAAMRTRQISRAQELRMNEITIGDVESALRRISR